MQSGHLPNSLAQKLDLMVPSLLQAAGHCKLVPCPRPLVGLTGVSLTVGSGGGGGTCLVVGTGGCTVGSGSLGAAGLERTDLVLDSELTVDI